MNRFRRSRFFIATLVASFLGTIAGLGYLARESQAALHASAADLTAPGPIGGTTPGAGSFTTLSATGTTTFANGQIVGTAANARIVFNSNNSINFNYITASSAGIGYSNGFQVGSGQAFSFNSAAAASAASGMDLQLSRDAAATLAQKDGTNAQVSRLYFSTTGPVYWQQAARTAGILYTGSGGAAQVSYAQTTVPTITTNGGTSPACVGTDTAMTCTEGTSPPAAATITVTFNGTWPAAPSCVALRGTAGASPLVQNVVTTTTTVQVNLSANLVASEKYHIHCYGVS